MRKPKRPWQGVWALAPLLSLGCLSGVSKEVPLERWSPASHEQIEARLAGDRSPELTVLLAFSGGGTRAASFSYGVLQELAATEVATSKGTRSLLDEVDAVSSVSGGSFASAYFGLKGKGILDDFEERFLRKNIEGAMIRQLFIPTNWLKLLHKNYARSDLAAEYYGRQIFDDASFADLNRPGAPLILINTTEIGSGLRFPFFRGHFDMLCIDLDKYPVARAVAASSAVPGLLSPLTLESHAGTCGYQPSPHLVELANEKGRKSIEGLEAHSLLKLASSEKRTWLHLVDGGIADNLGLRAYYSGVSLYGGIDEAIKELEHSGPHHVLLILVNSITLKTPEFAHQGRVPGLKETLGRVSGIELARYDVDTVQLVRDSFEKWTKEASTAERPISFDFVDVNFEAMADEDERAKLNDIGTNFHLPDEDVDLLLSAARKILGEAPAFQAFLERVGGATGSAP